MARSVCGHNVLGASAVLTLSMGATDSLASEDYSVYFADIPLSIALNVIGRDLGYDFSNESIGRQRVRDLEISGPAEDVVAQLMRETGMQSFSFNGQIFVAPAEDSEVRLVRLTNLTPERALNALADAGLLVPEFDIKEVADGKALVLSGPVKYLALSESVIASLEAKPAIAEEPVRVRRAGKLESERVVTLSDETAVN